jgi:hypothetical protein
LPGMLLETIELNLFFILHWKKCWSSHNIK